MSLGFTSPQSPLHCELDAAVAAIGRLLDAARAKGAPVVYTTVSYGEGEKAVAKAFIEKVPRAAHARRGKRVHRDRSAHRPAPTRAAAEQALRVGLLRNVAAEPARRTRLRLGARHRGLDLRLRTRDGGRRRSRTATALVIPREAVGDRNPAAHDQALYDVDAKYGDVVSLEEALDWLASIPTAAETEVVTT